MGKKSREKRERAQARPADAAPAGRDAADRTAAPPAEKPVPLFPRRQVLLVAAVALAWRAIYALLYQGSPFYHEPVVDAQTFHLWAEAIRDGRVFMPGVFFKPPLYPYVLSFLYDLFGARPEPVYLVQSLIGAGTCVLVLGLGRCLVAPHVALLGAVICAVLPILPFFEFQLVAEPLTTLLTVAALLLVVTSGERRGKLAVAGLLLGVAALGRPNLLLLVPVLAVWAWRRYDRRLAGALALLIGAGVGIAPATLHNLGEGRLVLVSANAGVNLWTGIRPGADGVSAIPIGIQWDDVQLEAAEAGFPDPAGADRWLVRRSRDQALGDPLRALGLLGRKTLLLVNAHEGRNNIGPEYLARTQGVVVLHRWWPGSWLLLPLALLGLVALLRERPRPWPPALAPTLLVLATLAVAILPFFVNARFRQPLLPLLAIFAAHGLLVVPAMLKAGGRRAATGLAVLIVGFGLVNAPWFLPDRARGDAEDELNLAGILARGWAGRPPDLEAALARLQVAARLDPRNPDIPERRGLLLQMAAYELLDGRQLALRRGGDPEAVSELEAAARRRLVEAVEQHRRAIRLFPRSFRSLGSAGGAHLMLGGLTAVAVDAALAAGDSTRAQALAREAAGDLEAGTLAWQQALRLKSDLPGGRESLSSGRQTLAGLPDLDPAVTVIKERVLSR